MTAPPPDSRDPRVEKLAAHIRTEDFHDAPAQSACQYARLEIREVEAAGLLVLDPKDDALVERVAEALYVENAKGASRPVRPWGKLDGYERDWVREQYRVPARAVLAALANPGGES